MCGRVLFWMALAVGLFFARNAAAWAEPEHVALSEATLRHLRERHPKDATSLQSLWESALRGHTYEGEKNKWCSRIDGNTDYKAPEDDAVSDPLCIDLPALTMLAGDHSCGLADLSRARLDAWSIGLIRKIKDIQREGTKLAAAARANRIPAYELEERREQLRRRLDIELIGLDPLFADRAMGNVGHFVAPRDTPLETAAEYIKKTIGATAADIDRPNVSAWAQYAIFHVTALRYVKEAGAAASDEDRRRNLYWAFLAEAYALHYLEDIFAAGHLATASARSDVRAGTHDHFSRRGLEVTLWGGEAAIEKAEEMADAGDCPGSSYVAYGDVYISGCDFVHTRRALAASLRQFLRTFEAASQKTPDASQKVILLALSPLDPLFRESKQQEYNTCKGGPVPGYFGRNGSDAVSELLRGVFDLTPRPPLARPGLPEMRSEYGFFLSPSLSAGLGAIYHPETGDAASVWTSTIDARAGLGLGFGTEGITSHLQDGLFLASGNVALSVRQLDPLASPAFAFGFSLRVPLAYVPGDGLLFILGQRMGIPGAADQLSRATSAHWLGAVDTVIYSGDVTRLQFDLGREVSVLWRFGEVFNDVCTTQGCAPRGTGRIGHAGVDLSFSVLTMRMWRLFENASFQRPRDTNLGERSGDALIKAWFDLGFPTDGEVLIGPEGAARHPNKYYIGGRLSFSEVLRYYVWSP